MWLEHLEFFLEQVCRKGLPSQGPNTLPLPPFPGSAGSWSEPCVGGSVFMHWMAHGDGDAVVADPAGTLVCYFLWSSGEDLPPVK